MHWRTKKSEVLCLSIASRNYSYNPICENILSVLRKCEIVYCFILCYVSTRDVFHLQLKSEIAFTLPWLIDIDRQLYGTNDSSMRNELFHYSQFVSWPVVLFTLIICSFNDYFQLSIKLPPIFLYNFMTSSDIFILVSIGILTTRN